MAFWLPLIQAFAVGVVQAALSNPPDGPRVSDLKQRKSSYGLPIPKVFGESVRLSVNVIDQSDFREITIKRGGYGKRLIGGGDRFFGAGRVNTYIYRVDLVCHIADVEGMALGNEALKRIWANGKVIFDRDQPDRVPGYIYQDVDRTVWNQWQKTHDVMDEVEFVRGSDTQAVSTRVQALHPGENVPAYRGSTYVVLKDLQLSDFGNSIPTLEVEVETPITTVGEVVTMLAATADVDVQASNLSDTLQGYAIATQTPVWGSIQPLALAYGFDLIERGGGFETVRRGSSFAAVIDATEFGAVAFPADIASRVNVAVENVTLAPDEVTVTYLDVDRDFEESTQRARQGQGVPRNRIDVQITVAITADTARRLAQRILYEGVAATKSNRVSLPASYDWLREGMVIGVPVGGNVEAFRVSRPTVSPNGTIELDLVYQDALAYSSDLDGATGTFTPQTVDLSGPTQVQFMDAPIVDTGDDDTGYYVAVAGENTGWRGVDIKRTYDGGVTFELITSSQSRSVIADCTTTLADGPTDVWDYVNTVTIAPVLSVPESASEDDVLVRGANLAWIGLDDGSAGEFIHFTTVTAAGTSPETYVLSGLLRGRHGTESYTGSHVASERFVLFANDQFGRIDFGPADWNTAGEYLAPSIGQPDDDPSLSSFTFTNTGAGKRPRAGVHLNGVRDGSNNLTVTWERRTRFSTPQIGGGAVPLGEATEAYEVDVLSGATVLRTIVASTPSVEYSAADQTTDGLTPGDPVDVAVYQLSDIYGRGDALEGTV